MAAKLILFVCASALVAQAALGVGRFGAGLGGCGCGGRGYGDYGYAGLGYDIGAASALEASRGGCLPVVTSSAAPTGLGVSSENSYEGTVGVCGNLPLLGTAYVEGVFPTVGEGGIYYGCGDGAVGIIAEDRAGLGYGTGYGLGYGAGYGLGYGGYVGRGCGCGGI
ncbi:chorion class B protein L11-like [Bombyx mandarina]|uniref:Chorion early-middle B n=2 Tax=Bombyx TaxID=7090 RepID=A0A0K2S326_BOMMO|nr:chorion class B protein L11-like [Bombyx mandarina]XP_037872011.1 chorion class B protein L11-like [Bombyx mori]BAS21492.1 chorion early-middle B [Bombyx mori]